MRAWVWVWLAVWVCEWGVSWGVELGSGLWCRQGLGRWASPSEQVLRDSGVGCGCCVRQWSGPERERGGDGEWAEGEVYFSCLPEPCPPDLTTRPLDDDYNCTCPGPRLGKVRDAPLACQVNELVPYAFCLCAAHNCTDTVAHSHAPPHSPALASLTSLPLLLLLRP